MALVTNNELLNQLMRREQASFQNYQQDTMRDMYHNQLGQSISGLEMQQRMRQGQVGLPPREQSIAWDGGIGSRTHKVVDDPLTYRQELQKEVDAWLKPVR